MTTVGLQSAAFPQAPKLRLLPKVGSSPRRADAASRPQRVVSVSAAPEKPVLLAGGDTSARSSVRRDLAETMPQSTTFEQAGAIWELLIKAPEASMVVLSGELDGIPAESLMQMLMQRTLEVPVVCLDAADAVALFAQGARAAAR
jgi:hypothetical protein